MDLINSIDTYSLMARCLTGEATHEDRARLSDLLASHPDMKAEYDNFRMVLPEPCPVNGTSTADHLQKKLDQLNRRLKEEEALLRETLRRVNEE